MESTGVNRIKEELAGLAAELNLTLWQYIERQHNQWKDADNKVSELRKFSSQVLDYVKTLERALEYRDEQIKALKGSDAVGTREVANTLTALKYTLNQPREEPPSCGW